MISHLFFHLVLSTATMGKQMSTTQINDCCFNSSTLATLTTNNYYLSTNPTSTTLTTIFIDDEESSQDLILGLSLGITLLIICIIFCYFFKVKGGRTYGEKFYKNNAYDLKESEYPYEIPVNYNPDYKNSNKIVYNDSNIYSEAE
jgi:hypothetical protein